MQPPKTITDLPQFRVLDVSPSEPDENGYIDSKLSGVFNQSEGVREGKCWLLLPERNCLFGNLESFDPAARTATLMTSEKEYPKVKDQTFPTLDGYWQAYHVWMVTEPQWIWKELTFLPSDVKVERNPANGPTVGGDGQPIEEWISVRKIGDTRGKAHVYPANPQGGVSGLSEINTDGVILSGWTHGHCELCNGQIDSGDVAYIDPSEHWICKGCYTKYVATHDLSFLF
jgi:hypothetical protein